MNDRCETRFDEAPREREARGEAIVAVLGESVVDSVHRSAGAGGIARAPESSGRVRDATCGTSTRKVTEAERISD